MVRDTSDPKIDVYLADVLINGGHGKAFNAVKPLEFYGKEYAPKSEPEVQEEPNCQ